MNFSVKIIIALMLFSWPDVLLSSPTSDHCNGLKATSEERDDFEIFLAKSKSSLGVAISVPVILPVGIVEVSAYLPIALAAQVMTCMPTLALDIGMKSSGDLTQLCFAFMPLVFPIKSLPLTEKVYSETRTWRRTNIGRVVESKTSTSDCFLEAGGDKNLAEAYAVLEAMILDDRYYKVLTPVQLDEIDGKLRDLKLRMNAEKVRIKPLQDI